MGRHCHDTRRILAYCRNALDEIRQGEPTGATWERRWASLMALLRTACEMLKREAPEWWNDRMVIANKEVKGRDARNDWKPDIFGKFIWTDSNLFLHQGKLTTGQSVTVFLGGLSVQARVAGQEPPPAPAPQPGRKTEIYYHMNVGPYAGHDPRDLAGEAISWLQQQIEGAEA